MTVAEILYGIEILPKGKRRDRMLAEAEAAFAEDFAGRILPFDEERRAVVSGDRCPPPRAKVGPSRNSTRRSPPSPTRRGAILATRNTADFEGCGVRLVNPWQ